MQYFLSHRSTRFAYDRRSQMQVCAFVRFTLHPETREFFHSRASGFVVVSSSIDGEEELKVYFKH